MTRDEAHVKAVRRLEMEERQREAAPPPKAPMSITLSQAEVMEMLGAYLYETGKTATHFHRNGEAGYRMTVHVEPWAETTPCATHGVQPLVDAPTEWDMRPGTKYCARCLEDKRKAVKAMELADEAIAADEAKKCVICHGSGKVDVPYALRTETDKGRMVCTACDGSGRRA